jgi:hypothetical protein
LRHYHVAQDHVDGLIFEQLQSGLAAIGFEADKAQGFADRYAKLPDTLFIVDDQETNAEFFSHGCWSRGCGFTWIGLFQG